MKEKINTCERMWRKIHQKLEMGYIWILRLLENCDFHHLLVFSRVFNSTWLAIYVIKICFRCNCLTIFLQEKYIRIVETLEINTIQRNHTEFYLPNNNELMICNVLLLINLFLNIFLNSWSNILCNAIGTHFI